MKITLKKIIGHFSTITRHRHMVILHCKKAGIFYQGLFHDLSKYSPAEFWTGARYYSDGTKSPNEKEREIFGYSAAWLHHKGRNRHHFEYWQDYNPYLKKTAPVKMPVRFLKELICDRIAASKIYQGKNYTASHPLQYYKNGSAVKSLHPDTADMIETILTKLSNEGEDSMFLFLRNLKNY